MKHYVYDIRGSSGSGKSTLVRNILKRWNNEYHEEGKIQYHFIPELNLVILGKYEGKSTFDSSKLRKSAEQQEVIEKLVKKHNILLENVMIAHVFKRWCELAKEHGNYRFFYLKVDEQECIDRVLKRRKGNTDRTLKLENNNHRFFSTIQKTIDNLEAEGCWVKTLDNPTKKEAYQTVIRQIKKDLKEQDTTAHRSREAKYSVFDIRGTCASGKSTLVRNILKRHENEVRLDEDIPYHFVPELNLVVLGRYDGSGSGVDNVKGSDRIQDFMRAKLKRHNVMLEGVIVSHIFARWDSMASEYGSNYHFFHLSVDIEECKKRVQARRLARGDKRKFNPSNVIKFDESINRVFDKLLQNNRDVTVLENPTKKEAYQAVMKRIKKDLKSQEVR